MPVGARLIQRLGDRVPIAFEVTDGGAGLLSEQGVAFWNVGDISRAESVNLALWKRMMRLLAGGVGISIGIESGNTIWFTAE